jgi:hypothetical protein
VTGDSLSSPGGEDTGEGGRPSILARDSRTELVSTTSLTAALLILILILILLSPGPKQEEIRITIRIKITNGKRGENGVNDLPHPGPLPRERGTLFPSR